MLRALVIASSVDLLALKVPVAGNDMIPDWFLTSWLLVGVPQMVTLLTSNRFFR